MNLIYWVALACMALAASSVFASEEGNIVTRLEASGFQCETQSAGHQCVGRLSPYPEPVAVIVPKNFAFSGRYLVHLHGFVLGGANDRTFAAILKDFSFANLLGRAGATGTLMLVPSSKGSCDTYNQYFTARDGFEKLMDSLERVTGRPASRLSVALSGHSGAFQPMATILRAARSSARGSYASAIDQVTLFDASYSSIDVATYKSWLNASGSHQFFSVFRPGTGTETGSRKLWSALSSKSFSTHSTNVWEPGRGEILPSASSGDAANHWGTVRVYLPRFLGEF